MNIKQINENFVQFGCMAAIGASVSSLLIGVSPASALTTLVSGCSAGGFSGKIRINYEKSSSPARGFRVLDVSYSINKFKNQGGNKANVSFTNEGTLPVTRFNTGDRAIQDGKWHRLGGNYGVGSPPVTYGKFVFDKSLAFDPECQYSLRLR